MPKVESVKDNAEKVSLKEVFAISKWSISLIYKNLPAQTIVYIITITISRFRPLIYSFLFAKILDALTNTIKQPNASIKMVYPYVAIMLLYSILQTILSYFSNWSGATLRTRSWTILRRELYCKLNSLGIQTLEIPEVNNKIFRADEYIQNIFPFMESSVYIIANLVSFITTAVLVAGFMPIYSLIILVVTIPYVFMDKSFRKTQYKFRREHTEEERVAGWLGSSLSSPTTLQEISITNAFNWIDKKFIDFRNWMDNSRLKIRFNFAKKSHTFFVIRDFINIYTYIVLFKRFLQGTLSIGSISFWINTTSNFSNTLADLTSMFNDLTEFSMQLKDVFQLFNTQPAFLDGNKILNKLDKGPTIEFKKVSFKYPNTDRLVINNLDLKIKSGEKIAIVGHNGAGKTTLVKLISRFYAVNSGELLVNDININDLQKDSLYRNMGVLYQDFNNYSCLTVKENICIGNPEIEFNEVKMRTAAQTADAIKFIEEYPKKFDQILSERFKGGIRPSTGQWQKIAIARFFYRNAPLVIFDEPTASIDAVSEYNIFSEIYDFFEGKTVIIISHRFSTVRNADRILVLDEGKIVEEGSHAQLMTLNGKYAHGFNLQAEGYAQEVEAVSDIASN